MTQFYQNLLQKLDLATALKKRHAGYQAKVWQYERSGAFTLIGEAE